MTASMSSKRDYSDSNKAELATAIKLLQKNNVLS